MVNEYITSYHLPHIAEAIKIYVDDKTNEVKSSTDLLYVTYSELVKLRNDSLLQPGCFYYIKDYVTTTNEADTISAGHNFPIIVLATSPNTLSEEAITNINYADTYFNECNLNAWKIWYCLDNDTSRFSWVGATKKVPKLYLQFSDGMGYWVRNEDLILETSDMTYYGYEFIDGSAMSEDYKVIWFTQEYNSEISERIETTCFYSTEGGYEMDPLDVSIGRITLIDIEIGKGVIYRMIDEFGNDCPYDFKNIMFKNPNNTSDPNYYYTFTLNEINEIKDLSLCGKYCYNNVIGEYYNDQKKTLNNIVFINESETSLCYSNIFGSNCYSNTFVSNCYSNTFGNNCYSNTFGYECRYNTFVGDCYSNTFGNYCMFNTFDGYCTENKVNDNFISNTFNSQCSNNTVSSNCDNNTFGTYCSNKTIVENTSNTHIYSNPITIEGSIEINGDITGINTITATGNITALGFYQSSDERLKTFTEEYDINLDNLKNIKTGKFYWNSDEKQVINGGVSAQTVEQYFPELVMENEDGMKSVNYDGLAVVAIAAIKKLTDRIEQLEEIVRNK